MVMRIRASERTRCVRVGVCVCVCWCRKNLSSRC